MDDLLQLIIAGVLCGLHALDGMSFDVGHADLVH